ncbi:MAG: sel1 repeat family protein [Clostridia bacterium]|nr:sel1 repeat family protein [Clostridia bacterium]
MNKEESTKPEFFLSEYVKKRKDMKPDVFLKLANDAESCKNADALYGLADCFFNGIVVKPDFCKAAELYLKAAYKQLEEMENKPSHTDNIKVEQEYVNAVGLLLKDAYNGDVQAERKLADGFFNGTWGVKDYNQAGEWYLQTACASEGYELIYAMCMSDRSYHEYYLMKDGGKAIRSGDISSGTDSETGYIDIRPAGGIKIIPKDLDSLKCDAMKGDLDAVIKIADRYDKGIDVERDSAKAERLRELACQGHPAEIDWLYKRYMNGADKENGYNKAIDICMSFMGLAGLHEPGEKYSPPVSGSEYFESVNTIAMYVILHEMRNEEVNIDRAKLLNLLYDLYMLIEWEIPQINRRAFHTYCDIWFDWLVQAAKSNPYAAMWISVFYRRDEFADRLSDAEEKGILEALWRQDEDDAETCLAQTDTSGLNDSEPVRTERWREAKAKAWAEKTFGLFHRAAIDGDRLSMIGVAECYMQRMGCDYDYEEGEKWYWLCEHLAPDWDAIERLICGNQISSDSDLHSDNEDKSQPEQNVAGGELQYLPNAEITDTSVRIRERCTVTGFNISKRCDISLKRSNAYICMAWDLDDLNGMSGGSGLNSSGISTDDASSADEAPVHDVQIESPCRVDLGAGKRSRPEILHKYVYDRKGLAIVRSDICRFLYEMETGDIVVCYDKSVACFGIVESDYYFGSKEPRSSGKHCRDVRWLRIEAYSKIPDELIDKTYYSGAVISLDDSRETVLNYLEDAEVKDLDEQYHSGDLAGSRCMNTGIFEEAARKIIEDAYSKGFSLKNYRAYSVSQRKQFLKSFGPDALKSIPDNKILSKLFLGDKSEFSMCQSLHAMNYGIVGAGLGPDSCRLFGLNYDIMQGWITDGSKGTLLKVKKDKAIEIGKQIRDKLIVCCEVIKDAAGGSGINSLADYINLQEEMERRTRDGEFSWRPGAIMYFHTLYPEYFAVMYDMRFASDFLQRKLDIAPDSHVFGEIWQFLMIEKAVASQLGVNRDTMDGRIGSLISRVMF